jgi:hypothetical protein
MYSKFTRNAFFKRYEGERRERYKIAKQDQKAYRDLKNKKPYDPSPIKQNKYPDEPLSEFEDYDKNDMIVESVVAMDGAIKISSIVSICKDGNGSFFIGLDKTDGSSTGISMKSITRYFFCGIS